MTKLNTLTSPGPSPIPVITRIRGCELVLKYQKIGDQEPNVILGHKGVEKILREIRERPQIEVANAFMKPNEELQGWDGDVPLAKIQSDLLKYKNQFSNQYVPLIETIPFGLRELIEHDKTPIILQDGTIIDLNTIFKNDVNGVLKKLRKSIDEKLEEGKNLYLSQKQPIVKSRVTFDPENLHGEIDPWKYARR